MVQYERNNGVSQMRIPLNSGLIIVFKLSGAYRCYSEIISLVPVRRPSSFVNMDRYVPGDNMFI